MRKPSANKQTMDSTGTCNKQTKMTDDGICYLCGDYLKNEINRDHVPPKQFYAKALRKIHAPNLLTIPVHRSCNAAYQKDEDYFIHSISPLAKNSFSGNALWQDIARQFARPQGARMGAMISAEFDNKPSGLYLPNGMVVKRFDGKRVWRIVWKIVRGLFYKEHGRLLPEGTLVTYRKVVSVGEHPPQEFEAVRNTQSRGQYPAVFDYKYIVVPELNDFHIWAMLFWGSLIKIIGFHDPLCLCLECQERREKIDPIEKQILR